MKETVASEHVRVGLAAPVPGLARLDATTARARSQIVWGEHCSECAYPTCYASCAFYDPRPDLNCRRFEAGIEAAGEGVMRIRFRKWGKLEGKGPARLWAWGDAARREWRDALVSRTLAHAPLPFSVARKAAWLLTDHKTRASRAAALAMDAFVVEGWSVDGRARAFTLTFLQDVEGARGTLQRTFELGAGLGRLSVPVGEIASAIRLDLPYLIQIEPIGEAAGVDAAFSLIDFVGLRTPVATAPRAPAPAFARAAAPALAKVLVWDLDETLWTGTLAEDGPLGVTPRPEAVAAIKALDRRGVLQSIASKNDPGEGLAALRRFGLADYFLHPQITWGPKSGSLAQISAKLDLGLDSFVFVDDQPFERAEIQAAHPQVRVLSHTDVAALPAHPWFDLPATPEAGRRRALYRAEAEREGVLRSSGGDYLAFLCASDLRLDIRSLDGDDVARVHELSQRTNQLNFTGAKLGLAEVEAMAEPDPARLRLTLRCADRFGDYGLIGFADLDLARGRLDAFFMSCRVQRKRVEHAAFSAFAAHLRAAGRDRFAVAFHPTERNGASARLLRELDFTTGESGLDEGGSDWTRDLARPFADADVVRIAGLTARARAA